MTWEEFKDFLRKNLGDDRAFANSILSQFRRVSQHQQESVLEWAAHFEHLQLILLAYDLVGAPAKPTMLRYFRESLRPSILAKLQNKDRNQTPRHITHLSNWIIQSVDPASV